MLRPTVLIASLLGIAATAGPAAARELTERERRLLEGKVTGPAINCIRRRDIEDITPAGDRVLIYRMRNGPDYRVDLPQSCPILAPSRAITTRSSVESLCSTETITISQPANNIVYGSCQLGRFQPYELPARGGR